MYLKMKTSNVYSIFSSDKNIFIVNNSGIPSCSCRLKEIDTCKGLLIIMLVFHHINSMAILLLTENSMKFLETVDVVNVLFVPYFMQTFFFITGYCTSFDKTFRTFFVKNFKSLIIPLVAFSTFNQLFDWIIFKQDFIYIEVLGNKFFYIVELFWFLPALFFAKLLMFMVGKLTDKSLYQAIFVASLFLFATAFIKYRFHSFNYFHWHNALSMLPFLWCGVMFRKYCLFFKLKRWRLLSISISYIVIVTYLYFSNRLIPYYTHFPHYTYKYVPLYLWLAFSGTIMVLQLSKAITPNKYLTYLGQNTIIVYGMHFTILTIVIIMLKVVGLSIYSFYSAIIFYVTTGIVTLFIVFNLCRLFQYRPLNYLIGRF